MNLNIYISEVKDCQSRGIVAVLLPEVDTLTQIAQQVFFLHFTVQSVVCTVHCVLCTVYCVLHTVDCVLWTAYCVL